MEFLAISLLRFLICLKCRIVIDWPIKPHRKTTYKSLFDFQVIHNPDHAKCHSWKQIRAFTGWRVAKTETACCRLNIRASSNLGKKLNPDYQNGQHNDHYPQAFQRKASDHAAISMINIKGQAFLFPKVSYSMLKIISRIPSHQP